VKTDLIDLRAVVTDKRGKPITDLKKEDFELSENGKPQEISFFSMVKISGKGEVRRAASPSAEKRPDRESEARPASGGPETPARSVILYVDTLHLSPQSLLNLKQSMRKFIDEHLTDQDLTAIVTSAGSLGVVEQFTRDRQVLRLAVARLSARQNARDTLFTPYIAAMVDRGNREALQVATAIYAAEERLPPNDPTIGRMVEARARQIMSEVGYTRRATLITLREVVQKLEGLPGQRLLVMASDGFTLLDSGGGNDTGDLQSVTSRATRSGVVIYTIDAKGLKPPALFDASIGTVPSDPRISSYISAGERDLENGLNALAHDTGGDAFFNTNDTAGAMARALDDNQIYYAVAYYPSGEESEKKYRKITLKIKNHPEYLVRSQRGYLPADLSKKAKEEAAKTPQQRLVAAALSPLPMTEVAVAAVASFAEVPTDAAQATLKVYVDGKTLTYREEGGRFHFEAEILTMIYNSDGRRVDLKSQIIQGNLTPARLEDAKRYGFLYARRIPLKPGLYQARVGVREIPKAAPGGAAEEQVEGRMGSSAAWVEVPDLSKKNKPALSDLFTADATEVQNSTPASENGKENTLAQSRVIQGVRYFPKAQPLVYFFWIYNTEPEKNASNQSNRTTAARPDANQSGDGLELQIEILKDEAPYVTSAWQPAKTREIGRDSKGISLGGQLGINKFEPGVYELRVSIRSPKLKRPLQRTTVFGIEP
jgi:VWFA-related protein